MQQGLYTHPTTFGDDEAIPTDLTAASENSFKFSRAAGIGNWARSPNVPICYIGCTSLKGLGVRVYGFTEKGFRVLGVGITTMRGDSGTTPAPLQAPEPPNRG